MWRILIKTWFKKLALTYLWKSMLQATSKLNLLEYLFLIFYKNPSSSQIQNEDVFFQVIFLFPVFWKHHEDDTNVLPYCTIIVDSKGGRPCEKAWYSKCLYLMVCYEIEMGIHSLCSETFVIYFFHTWSMKISGIQILSALLQVG